MILTDKEIFQLSIILDGYYIGTGSIRVFNSLVEKVRESAKGRKNVNEILQILHDLKDRRCN